MREYENKPCGCCGEKFKSDDEIVICPECGTPIHKKCWDGHCPNEARHAEGYDWDKENSGKAPTERRAVCEICGQPFREDDDIVYCAECGTPTHRSCREKLGHCPNESRHVGETNVVQVEASSFEEFVEKIQQQEKETGEEHTCFGVKHSELIHFLGTKNFSTPRFYSLFFNMATTGRKVSFNFLAGLLMPFYQFYRKMVGPSAVLSLAVLLLELPQMVMWWMYLLHKDQIQSEMVISPQLYAAVEIFSYIYLILRIVIILFNDYIYMRWSVGRILTLREKYQGAPEAEYMEALERAGRPRFAFLAIGGTVFLTLSYVLLGVATSMGIFAA